MSSLPFYPIIRWNYNLVAVSIPSYMHELKRAPQLHCSGSCLLLTLLGGGHTSTIQDQSNYSRSPDRQRSTQQQQQLTEVKVVNHDRRLDWTTRSRRGCTNRRHVKHVLYRLITDRTHTASGANMAQWDWFMKNESSVLVWLIWATKHLTHCASLWGPSDEFNPIKSEMFNHKLFERVQPRGRWVARQIESNPRGSSSRIRPQEVMNNVCKNFCTPRSDLQVERPWLGCATAVQP